MPHSQYPGPVRHGPAKVWPLLLVALALSGLASLPFPPAADAASVNLAWDPDPDPTTTYTIYYGTSSGNYPFSQQAGTQTTCTVTGLQEGQTYFFAAKACKGELCSGFSAEISYTVPAANQPPTASVSANKTSGKAPLAVNFTGSGTDPDGTIAGYSWSFGDGTTSTQQNPTHQYTAQGAYTVVLTVRDNDGASETATLNIAVSSAALEEAAKKLIAGTGPYPSKGGSHSLLRGGPPLQVPASGRVARVRGRQRRGPCGHRGHRRRRAPRDRRGIRTRAQQLLPARRQVPGPEARLQPHGLGEGELARLQRGQR